MRREPFQELKRSLVVTVLLLSLGPVLIAGLTGYLTLAAGSVHHPSGSRRADGIGPPRTAPDTGPFLAGLVLAMTAASVAVAALFVAARVVRYIDHARRAHEALQRRLVEAARLASVGELTAVMAHEISNPLAVIREEAGWIQDLWQQRRPLASESEIESSLRRIQQEVERCREFTRRILLLAHTAEPRREGVDINAFVVETVGGQRMLLSASSVRLELALGDSLPPIETDPAQLRQALLNLVQNAIDAMPGGGELRIATTALAGEAGGVRLEVGDSGQGIAAEHLGRVFEPFFTTKPPGKGTGLGLSICRQIVGQLGGTIRVDSRVGQGTRVSIELPRRDDASDQVAAG